MVPTKKVKQWQRQSVTGTWMDASEFWDAASALINVFVCLFVCLFFSVAMRSHHRLWSSKFSRSDSSCYRARPNPWLRQFGAMARLKGFKWSSMLQLRSSQRNGSLIIVHRSQLYWFCLGQVGLKGAPDDIRHCKCAHPFIPLWLDLTFTFPE